MRGTPQQIIEKYQMLARDAQLSGDRVAAENFQQHSEHYTRLLSDAMREQTQRREQQDAQRRDVPAQEQKPAAVDPRHSEQPDIVEQARDNSASETGLVETPESKIRDQKSDAGDNEQAAQ